MTADYVAHHAQQRPDAPALIDNGRTITYGEFARDLPKFMRAVRELGVPAAGTIAVGCDDLYVQWLILLACEELGIATASLIQREEASVLPLVAGIDLLLSEFPLPEGRPRHRHDLTPAWVESVLRLPAVEPPAPSRPPQEAVLRILRTSGTTGRFMRLALTRAMHERRIEHWLWRYGFSVRSRVMLAMPFVIGGVYSQACACLRAGGTLVRESRVEVPVALMRHAVTHVTLMPIYLRNVLDQVGSGFARLSELVVSTFGGAIAPSLRAEAVARLCVAVCDMYGCNEVGFIASNGLYRTGSYLDLWPGIALEAVDEEGRTLPAGEPGLLRVRTPSMFAGYIDDPEATGRMLREGWFYPGDLGVLRGSRELELLGRADAVLNIGGAKFLPERLERILRAGIGVEEVAVGSIVSPQSASELCIAIGETGSADAEIGPKIDALLSGVGFRKSILIRLARLPRDPAERIDRAALARAIATAVSGAKPGAG